MTKKKLNGWANICMALAACVGVSTLVARISTYGEIKGVQSHLVEDATKAVDELKEDTEKAVAGIKKDGCDPAVKSREDVSVIKIQLQDIQKDMSSVQIQQTALQAQQTAVSKKQDIQHAEVMKAIKETNP